MQKTRKELTDKELISYYDMYLMDMYSLHCLLPTQLNKLAHDFFWGFYRKYDKKDAFNCYKVSAEKGSTKARNNLGIMYSQGEGVEQDTAKAIYWLEKAAKQRNKQACTNLGYIYHYELKDKEKALYWYGVAIQRGCENAQDLLDELKGVGGYGRDWLGDW